MMRHRVLIALVLLFQLTHSLGHSAQQYKASMDLKEYKINLDAPPETRWVDPINDIIKEHGWEYSFGGIIGNINKKFTLVGCGQSCINLLANALKSNYPDEYNECKGISAVFQKYGYNISTEEVSSWQYFYEISHTPSQKSNQTSNKNKNYGCDTTSKIGADDDDDDDEDPVLGCTSIVACSSSGEIVHGRNLDYSWPTARNTTIHATFTRGGQPLYTGPVMAGTVTGTATGVLPGRLTFSYNWRTQKLPLADVLRCIQSPRAAAPISSFVRSRLFEGGASFAAAAYLFEELELCAAAYVILGGPASGDGIVITRSHNESIRPQRLGNCGGANASTPVAGRAAGRNESWYVAQTNYDAWMEQPPTDDRLGLAVGSLEGMGQEAAATGGGLWKVLSTPGTDVSKGVLNAQTLYTSVMSAKKGVEYTKIRLTEN